MTNDEGTIYDDAPLCLCCETALAQRLQDGSVLADPDLRVPICVDCGHHLYRARVALGKIHGVGDCVPSGPDGRTGGRL